MEIMRDVLLILSVLGVFVFGYFLMELLDKFLDENRKSIEKENKKKEPSCIVFTKEMSDEEIAAEIRRFREKHESTYVVLYDLNDIDLSESME